MRITSANDVLDKEKIGEWISKIKIPLARYLESNLKLSGPDSFKEQVADHLQEGNMKNKAVTNRDLRVLDEAAL